VLDHKGGVPAALVLNAILNAMKLADITRYLSAGVETARAA
jgi:hypothetical protein